MAFFQLIVQPKLPDGPSYVEVAATLPAEKDSPNVERLLDQDSTQHRLDGLVVDASSSRAADPGLTSRLNCEYFSGSSHTSDLNIAIPLATQ